MSSGQLPAARRPATGGRVARRLILVLGAVLLLAVIVDLVRLGLAVRDLDRSVNRLLAASSALGTQPTGWTDATVSAAERVNAAEGPRIHRAAATVAGDPLVRVAKHLPGAGDNVLAGLDLVGAADAAGASYPDLLQIARAYVTTTGGQGSPGARILALLQEAGPPAADAAGHLKPAAARLDRDRQRKLLPVLARRLERADNQLRPLASGLDLFQEASKTVPAALGADRPQTYLLLLPNPTELRPAGGYSGAVGTLTFNHGDPVFKIGDQYALNGKYKDHFDVPPTIGRYLHYANNSFEIGDSGWDPDFPSSARLGMRMFQSATGTVTVGEVAIDPYALADLLAITGPVEVKPYGSFDSTNILHKLNVLINVDNAPKESIGQIGEAIFARVIGQPSTKWADLGKALQKDVISRHIQIYASEPGLQGLVERAQASGELLPTPDGVDYLMAVDGNVGGTKGDYYLTKTADLKVERYPAGIARHELTLTYRLPEPTTPVDKTLNLGPYRDYLRIYLPETATVRGLFIYKDGKPTTDNSIDSIGLDHGRRVVATFMELPRGHMDEVHVFYEVAFGEDSAYNLMIQKQAGRPSLPTTVAISYPGAVLRTKTDLVADAHFEVHW